MRMLFVTQKVDPSHDDLAFVIQWVDEFRRQGYEVEVACLESVGSDYDFPVHSLGKEHGKSRLTWAAQFARLASQRKYDRVFVHMNPVYFTLMGWYWRLTKTPSYLWYTHYTDHIHMKLASVESTRMFAATDQSMPQYRDNPKRVITGHGIDTNFWSLDAVPDRDRLPPNRLLMVHRLSRSKRVEMGIAALRHLPPEYELTIVGKAIDPGYFDELMGLVNSLGLEERVDFRGPLEMRDLRDLYAQHSLMINMAPETIDKTVLESMRMGVVPLTTPENAKAIGDPRLGVEESSQSIASAILAEDWRRLDTGALASLVEERHGLERLVRKMRSYIDAGV